MVVMMILAAAAQADPSAGTGFARTGVAPAGDEILGVRHW